MDDRKMIYFVGAGSGAADLITVRGMRLLQEADVRCILEWNEGNHFRDPSGRCAKGLLWCVDNVVRN